MERDQVAMVTLATRSVGARFVLWFQDSQGGLAGTIGSRPSIPSRVLSALEGLALRRADRVVTICEAMRDDAVARGVDGDDVRIVENWAPVHRLPMADRDNEWAREHGLVGRTCFLYSGTLARKHDPGILVALAEHLAVVEPDAVGVVVSEGVGSDHLRDVIAERDLTNLVLLPYQPFARLPEVLGAADVLVAVLEGSAGQFSVPSKILSYLCAGRAVLAMMPLDNLSSVVLTERSGAGIVVPPGDSPAFVAAADDLRVDVARREEMGARGRAYAEETFDPEAAADRFLRAAFGPR